MDVIAFAGESSVRPDDDLNQRIAWLALAGTGRALAAQAQDLAVLDAGGIVTCKVPPPGRVMVLVAPFTASRKST